MEKGRLKLICFVAMFVSMYTIQIGPGLSRLSYRAEFI